MAMSKRSFRMFIEEELGEVPHFFLWAVLEWILIIALYVDGFLAFLSNTFAKVFDLTPPCVLCTRVDHVLLGKDPNSYYNDSICECHKKDVSSLAYCHVHRKLCDIRNMCEGCLLSFATEKDSDNEANKSLIGVPQKEIDAFTEDDRAMFMKPGKNDHKVYNDDLTEKKCSCCGESLKVKPSKSYARSSSNLRNSSMAPTPSPRASITSTPFRGEDGRNLDLPQVRYTELKFISDNESEMPEDDYGLGADVKQVRESPVPLLPDSEEISEDKSPSLVRGNRFFGIPLTDSTGGSPRWANRLPKKIPLEKADLVSEAIDEASADGDSSLQYLKRQVRLDRKSLIALYMELDEERSAAAVAANNAMAMITRLQAEKAAVQMEASQYQRMMEEQAEYDQEAIQVLEDMLAKRDEDVKVLESELEIYKERYGEIKRLDSDECEVDADECYQEWRSQSPSSFGEKSECERSQSTASFGEKSECGSPGGRDVNGDGESHSGRMGENGRGSYEESSLDFETESSQLFSMLKNLENNIISSFPHGDHEDEDIGEEQKATLIREVCQIREKLRAIDSDSEFLEEAETKLENDDGRAEILTEIGELLQMLRVPEDPEDTNATDV